MSAPATASSLGQEDVELVLARMTAHGNGAWPRPLRSTCAPPCRTVGTTVKRRPSSECVDSTYYRDTVRQSETEGDTVGRKEVPRKVLTKLVVGASDLLGRRRHASVEMFGPIGED